jgi:parallel beta-helix repeat protein
MRRTIVLLATMTLTLLVASGVALAVTKIGSAGAQSSVVGPGESIQKAVNAAHPGDTIVVRGVHREDVVIRKNGIKLRGDDATLKPPARAGSPCSRVSGPTAICVLGDFNLETGEPTGPRVSDVSVSGFTIRGFKIAGKGDKDLVGIDVTNARNTTVVGNRVIGNVALGIGAAWSVNTTVAKNHVIRSGSPEPDEEGIVVEFSSRTKIVKNVFRGFVSGIDVDVSTNTTFAGNDLIGNRLGVLVFESTGTKILSNDISRSGDTGISIFGPEQANNDAKVVGNRISGGPWGIYVEGAHGGSFTGNQVHDNCAGMFFEAFGPTGEFEVKGNTVKNNTRSCRAAQFDTNFSGIGIALLGARDMEVKANHLSGNVPSGPTPVSGGVVVSTDPFFGGSVKPRNNSVTGNHFGRNKPDIFWDESGSGNSFVGNLCDTSVPSSLCN